MDGSHSCSNKLKKDNQALRKELEAVKADLDTALCTGFEVISGEDKALGYHIKQITLEQLNKLKADAVRKMLDDHRIVNTADDGTDFIWWQDMDKYADKIEKGQ